MPFGSNVITYQLVTNTQGEPRKRAVDVPALEAPWWWSEYLTDEWKRRNGLGSPRRAQTGLALAQAKWEHQERMYTYLGAERGMSTGMPRHQVWT